MFAQELFLAVTQRKSSAPIIDAVALSVFQGCGFGTRKESNEYQQTNYKIIFLHLFCLDSDEVGCVG